MRAIHDNIIVRQVTEDVSGNIFVPPVFRRKMQLISKGVVVSAGKGDGDQMKMPVGPGNIVVYGKNSGFDIDFKGERLRVIKLHQMFCAK